MSPEQLDEVAETSAKNLKELIGESNTEIREAIGEALQAAEDEKKDTGMAPNCKISLTHKLEIDLVRHKQLDRLSWSVAHKIEKVQDLPDPDQANLALEE